MCVPTMGVCLRLFTLKSVRTSVSEFSTHTHTQDMCVCSLVCAVNFPIGLCRQAGSRRRGRRQLPEHCSENCLVEWRCCAEIAYTSFVYDVGITRSARWNWVRFPDLTRTYYGGLAVCVCGLGDNGEVNARARRYRGNWCECTFRIGYDAF